MFSLVSFLIYSLNYSEYFVQAAGKELPVASLEYEGLEYPRYARERDVYQRTLRRLAPMPKPKPPAKKSSSSKPKKSSSSSKASSSGEASASRARAPSNRGGHRSSSSVSSTRHSKTQGGTHNASRATKGGTDHFGNPNSHNKSRSDELMRLSSESLPDVQAIDILSSDGPYSAGFVRMKSGDVFPLEVNNGLSGLMNDEFVFLDSGVAIPKSEVNRVVERVLTDTMSDEASYYESFSDFEDGFVRLGELARQQVKREDSLSSISSGRMESARNELDQAAIDYIKEIEDRRGLLLENLNKVKDPYKYGSIGESDVDAVQLMREEGKKAFEAMSRVERDEFLDVSELEIFSGRRGRPSNVIFDEAGGMVLERKGSLSEDSRRSFDI